MYASKVDTEKMKAQETFSPTPVNKVESRREGAVEDVKLDQLGLQAEIKRDISSFAIIAVGWNICNSWAGIAATLALSIASGGTVTLIYGLIVVLVFGSMSALSLAEIASVYPTAGGQYHWTSILAPERWSRALSYCCGAVNVFGWIALSAGICIIPPQLIAAMVVFFHPSYVPEAWHIFLMFQALNILMLLYNILLLKRTLWVMDFGFALSLGGFFTVFVVCLAMSSPKQPSEFVWTAFINSSGWKEDGIVFLTGLVNPNYMYAGLDGAIHLAEDCKNAAHAVPRALLSTVVIGFITSFAFAVAMTYSMSDFDAVLSTPTGVPIYELWYQATGSEAAATVFIVVVLLCGLFALAGSMQTSSRLTWSFGRDDAMLGSKYFGHVSKRFGVPVYALLFDSLVIFIIGCVYLGSTTAFNAMTSTGLILQHVSYAFPVICLMLQRRSSRYLPPSRGFRLGALGWVANVLTVIFSLVVLVFYNFPFVMPVTAGTMNYACVVLGAMAAVTVANWFLHAHKRYRGPRIE